MLQRAHGVLGLVDALGTLRQPQGDELRQKLVEIAPDGGLLGDLAERGDRDDVANVAPLDHGRPDVVDDEP